MPYSLKVGWHLAGARRGDEEVTAELIIELLKVGILGSLTVSLEAAVDGHVGEGGVVAHKVKAYATEEVMIVGIMLLEQTVIAFVRSLIEPRSGGGKRIDTDVCLGVMEVGGVVGAIVRVGSDEEHHLVSTLHRDASSLVGQRTAVVDGLYADGVLHVVVVQTGVPQQGVRSYGGHLALRNGIGGIREGEVLHAFLRCLEAYGKDVGGATDEVFATIVDTVFAELHDGKGGIERERTAIASHSDCAKPGLHVEFTGCGETSEAERILSVRLVRHFTVKVLLSQL